jgi:hypothetical protein
VAHSRLRTFILLLLLLLVPTIVFLGLLSLEITKDFLFASLRILAVRAIVSVVSGHHKRLGVAHFVEVLVLLLKMSKIVPFSWII